MLRDERAVAFDPAQTSAWVLGLMAILVGALAWNGLERGYWDALERAILAAYSAALAPAGLYWLYYGFKRRRAIEDIPTSRIGSAAQGYVEVSGEAFRLPEIEPLFSWGGVACLWYRTVGESVPEDGMDGTHKPFGIRDRTGAAVVFPRGALVQAVHHHRWRGDDGAGRTSRASTRTATAGSTAPRTGRCGCKRCARPSARSGKPSPATGR